MTIASTNLVPELQYYFNNFVKNSALNKNLTSFPSSLNILYLDENKSFIRLLFDENYSHTTYRYLYRLGNESEIPTPINIRLKLYPSSGRYYLCDNDSTAICNINLFSLENDDLNMLDKLLDYRMDSTSCDISYITYINLNTNLSKLIFLYLDLKINNNYSNYDNENLVSETTRPLEVLYENIVVEEIYKYISELDGL